MRRRGRYTVVNAIVAYWVWLPVVLFLCVLEAQMPVGPLTVLLILWRL